MPVNCNMKISQGNMEPGEIQYERVDLVYELNLSNKVRFI